MGRGTPLGFRFPRHLDVPVMKIPIAFGVGALKWDSDSPLIVTVPVDKWMGSVMLQVLLLRGR